MTILNKRYHLQTDTATGLARITITGRCTSDEASNITSGCTRRFKLQTLPAAAGAVFKPLDGTNPTITTITPSTISTLSHSCVKIDGRVNPLAPSQPGGTYKDKTILSYEMVYQEVGKIV